MQEPGASVSDSLAQNGRKRNEQRDAEEKERKKKNVKRREEVKSEEIDTDECCVCFGNYQQDVAEGLGTEWISCVCGDGYMFTMPKPGFWM